MDDARFLKLRYTGRCGMRPQSYGAGRHLFDGRAAIAARGGEVQDQVCAITRTTVITANATRRR